MEAILNKLINAINSGGLIYHGLDILHSPIKAEELYKLLRTRNPFASKQINGFSKQELETIDYFLLSVRTYTKFFGGSLKVDGIVSIKCYKSKEIYILEPLGGRPKSFFLLAGSRFNRIMNTRDIC